MDSEMEVDFPSDGEDQLLLQMEIPVNKIVSVPKVEFDSSFRLMSPRDFRLPYQHTYNQRLEKLSSLVKEMSAERFPNTEVVKIKDLWQDVSVQFKQDVTNVTDSCGWQVFQRPEEIVGKQQFLKPAFTKPVVIIGTIIRDHGNSIMHEFGETIVKSKTVKKSECALEDASAKIILSFSEDCQDLPSSLINGQVCGVYGSLASDGRFLCKDVAHSEPEIKLMRNPVFNYKMVIISGLQYGLIEKEKCDRLFQALEGYASSDANLIVIFLGNTLCLKDIASADLNTVIQDFDEKIFNLAKKSCVVIIPGLQDPVPPMLPHQPLKQLFFRKSCKQENFYRETNPCRMFIPARNGKKMEVLMCSGETVDDYMKASGITDPLMAGKMMIWSGHLCPTAPDSTAISPGLATDVFALEKAPVFFIFGNQNAGAVSESKRTVYASVPKYAEQQQVLVFNGDAGGSFVKII